MLTLTARSAADARPVSPGRADAPPLIYSDEVRLFRTPDQCVWAQGWGGYSFLAHFLAYFSSVTVVARIKDVDEPPPGGVRCDGPGVSFAPIPYYLGPVQYFRNRSEVDDALRQACRPGAVYLLRAPSQLAVRFTRFLNAPFGLLVTADPDLNFRPGSNAHPLRPLFRWKYMRDLRRLAQRAAAVGYVTREALQQKYPPTASAFRTHFTGAELDDRAFTAVPRVYRSAPRPLRIVTVGSFVQLYKGQDVLIRALSRCARAGLGFQATFIGDGVQRPAVEALAMACRLESRIRFTGMLPSGPAIRRELDAHDLFVLPSRAEGLPRALLEAMARGLPAIATSVGGVPELLTSDVLAPPGDSDALARLIVDVGCSPERMTSLAESNLRAAAAYRFTSVLGRRVELYNELIRRTVNAPEATA